MILCRIVLFCPFLPVAPPAFVKVAVTDYAADYEMIGETRISHFQPNHRWVTSLLPHTIWNTCRFHRVLHNQCRYKHKSMTNNVNSNMYTPYISRQTHTSFSITRPEFCIFLSPGVAVTVDTLHCWQLMAFAYIDGRKESNACGINSITILLILTETM